MLRTHVLPPGEPVKDVRVSRVGLAKQGLCPPAFVEVEGECGAVVVPLGRRVLRGDARTEQVAQWKAGKQTCAESAERGLERALQFLVSADAGAHVGGVPTAPVGGGGGEATCMCLTKLHGRCCLTKTEDARKHV